jgi:pimeloyl-ACP methyl ester carboxylesterase
MHIYLLAGLGADERLFKFLDFDGHAVTNVRWETPSNSDTMESYAKKLASQITQPDAVLIGVSFGGMIAIELGKIIQTKRIILISSIPTAGDLPVLYRMIGKVRIHRLFPGRFLKNSHRFMNWVMCASDPLRKELLSDMLRDTDEDFIYWAIDKVVTWKNNDVPANVVRIHGTKDFVLPMRGADHQIGGGGHLIVANRANEINACLRKLLTYNTHLQ